MSISHFFRACGAVALFFSSVAAHAWGYDGHRITADIASALLTPQARVRVGQLLMGGSLPEVASYMDDERRSLKHLVPGSDKWHYDNLPVCGSTRPASVCPQGDCATARIDQLTKLLADARTDQATRTFALKALVHLIADIHQPLHAADDNDHGGNDLMVGSRSLHSEWDSGLVKKLTRRQSDEDYAAGLLVRYNSQIRNVQNGNASAWAAESHDIAVKTAYGALPGFSCGQPMANIPRLPTTYYDASLPIVESQLFKAGVRIAFTINQALGQ